MGEDKRILYGSLSRTFDLSKFDFKLFMVWTLEDTCVLEALLEGKRWNKGNGFLGFYVEIMLVCRRRYS